MITNNVNSDGAIATQTTAPLRILCIRRLLYSVVYGGHRRRCRCRRRAPPGCKIAEISFFVRRYKLFDLHSDNTWQRDDDVKMEVKRALRSPVLSIR